MFSFFLLALFNLALNSLSPRCYLVSALVGCTVGLCLLMEISQEKSALSTLSGAVTYWFLCPNQNVCAWNLFTKETKPRKFSYEANHCHQVGKRFTCMLWWMSIRAVVKWRWQKTHDYTQFWVRKWDHNDYLVISKSHQVCRIFSNNSLFLLPFLKVQMSDCVWVHITILVRE